MNLVVEKRVPVKNTEFFILSSKNEDVKNVRTTYKFIKHLNEKSTNDLREIDIINRIGVATEVSKTIHRK